MHRQCRTMSPTTKSDPAPPAEKPAETQSEKPPKRKRGWFRHIIRWTFFLLIFCFIALAVSRPFLPGVVRYYVNRVLDQSQTFKGKIGDVDLHIWRGAYTIHNVRLLKASGNVPVPLFSCDRIDLRVQWPSLMYGHIVGEVLIVQPEVNFVDASEEGGDGETGAGGPWLKMLRDLFPFQINSVIVQDGSIHFRTYKTKAPVDVYLNDLQAKVSNLTNIHNEMNPLVATVNATGKAMDQADFEFVVKLDPFSYNPTFNLAVRLLGLDLTKINDLTMAYGGFDVKRGLFDLVVQVDAKEGQLDGTVKPLFRNMVVFDVLQDVKEDKDPLQFFWQGIVGSVAFVLTNQDRGQFGTLIPFTGTLAGPNIDFLTTLGNVLRNAFIRAYLPRLEDQRSRDDGDLSFGPAKLTDPISAGDNP